MNRNFATFNTEHLTVDRASPNPRGSPSLSETGAPSAGSNRTGSLSPRS
jgi:hypothetical protein